MVFAPLLAKPPTEDINEEMKVNRKAALLWSYMIENSEDILDLLPCKMSNIRLFGNPNDISSNNSIDRLCARGTIIYYSTGDTIIETNQQVNDIFLIRKGKVSIKRGHQVFHELSQGMLLDYSLFLRSSTYYISPWSCEASSICEIAKIDIPLFRAILESGNFLFFFKDIKQLALLSCYIWICWVMRDLKFWIHFFPFLKEKLWRLTIILFV